MTQPGQGEHAVGPWREAPSAMTPAPVSCPWLRWLPATAWVNWCDAPPVCGNTARWHAIVAVDPFGGG